MTSTLEIVTSTQEIVTSTQEIVATIRAPTDDASRSVGWRGPFHRMARVPVFVYDYRTGRRS